jgi:hypothetical protein
MVALIVTMVLALVGLVMVFSASAVVAGIGSTTPATSSSGSWPG